MSKPNPRKLKPIQLLPKLKDLQKEDSIKKVDIQNIDEQKVDFSSQTAQKGFLRKLLSEGNVGAYADFYNLTSKIKQLSEKDMEFIQSNLERVEDELFAGKRLKALKNLHDLANNYLDKDNKEIARYFYNKVLNVAKKWGFEEGNQQNFDEAYVKAQLGFIKCLDFNTESDLALTILREASYNEKYKESVTLQLIELHGKMADIDEVRSNYEQALDHYSKSLEACKTTNNFDEESSITLKVARLLSIIEEVPKAIILLKESLHNAHKLKKNKPIHHEIECYKQLAACYELLNDWDDAEVSYKSLNELLKHVHDDKFIVYKSTANSKLGLLHWKKNNNKEAIKYYEEFLGETLKARPRSWKLINDARLTLGTAKGLDTFEDFAQYINISKNRIDDVIMFKKTGRIDNS